MKRALLLVLLTGCVSDLAVGTSRLLREEDAAEPAEPDAGEQLDAGDGPVVYTDADAAVPFDASSRDAGRDAGSDAARYPKLCPIAQCINYLVMEGCDGGIEKVCAQPGPNQLCEWLCL